MENKLVSVIISVYNAEKYIAKALDSIILQTYKNIEIIVVNDGSTDGTSKILENYIDKGVKVFRQENKGQDAALNFGFNQSNGELIKFFDADDILSDNCIKLQVESLDGKKNYIAYGEFGRFFNDSISNAIFKQHSYYRNLSPIDFLTSDKAGPMLQCGIMLIHRNLILQSGLWDERLILYNDTEFFTRIILKSKGVIFTKGAKLYYRSGMNTNLSSQKARKYFESTLLATQLIKECLFAIEKSERTKRLIANLFWVRRYEMFPKYKDLARLYAFEIKSIGCSNIVVKSSFIFNLIQKIFGWKVARLFQLVYYKLRYQ